LTCSDGSEEILPLKVKAKNFLASLLLRIPKQLQISRIRRIQDYRNLESSLLNVGNGTYGSNNIVIHNWDLNSRAFVGNYCSIADNVHLFLGGNHDMQRVTTFPFSIAENGQIELGGPTFSKGDINIGNDVWIGSHVSIMSGIRVGNGAVIAAFSHVVKDVLDYEVVGGNPATHIKFRFSRKTIEALLEISWWDWSEDKIIENQEFLLNPPE
jgi:acetyltransferase-like isoleucine patch superfamily enzyme